MGLEELDGMGVPDNKGGRPSHESESEYSGRRSEGHPHTMNKESEDWWRVKYHQWRDETDSINAAIMELSEDVFVNPLSIRVILDEYGIYETDWEEYIEDHPMYANDARVPGNEINSSGTAGMSSRLDDVFSGSSSGNDDDDGPSDGLASLI